MRGRGEATGSSWESRGSFLPTWGLCHPSRPASPRAHPSRGPAGACGEHVALQAAGSAESDAKDPPHAVCWKSRSEFRSGRAAGGGEGLRLRLRLRCVCRARARGPAGGFSVALVRAALPRTRLRWGVSAIQCGRHVGPGSLPVLVAAGSPCGLGEERGQNQACC